MRVLTGLIFICFSLAAVALAGESAKVGIIKGTITVGGVPTSDAVVSIEGASFKDGAESGRLAVMDQRGMKFVPRVLPILVGTKVDFPNNDKTWHNVFSTSQAKKFDLGLYQPGKSRSVEFDKTGVVKILCNVHPSMEAFIVVKDHPYFAVADKQGDYRIMDVPLGKFRLQVWHPEFGTETRPFHLVRDGEVLSLNIDLKKK